MYSLIFVGPVRKPHCWFSHKAAHIVTITRMDRMFLKGHPGFFNSHWKLVHVRTSKIFIFVSDQDKLDGSGDKTMTFH